MSLAIVEILVECNSDDKFAIQGAMQVTADRLRQKWADKRLWNAVFNSLPKKKKLLTDLKLAAKVFYGNPADKSFEEKLRQVLQEQQKFSIKATQKAAREYTDTLTEELFLADTGFREILRGISKPRPPEDPLAGGTSAGKPAAACPPKKVKATRPILPAEQELQTALAALQKLPPKRIPQPASMPKGSHVPSISPNPRFVGREDELKQLAVWLKKGKKPVVIGQAASVDGMGGVGKTQLASEFAWRYGKYFSGGVFWLNFADPDLIPFEIAACGDPVNGSPLDVRVKRVLLEWQSEIPRLLIFDNCEDLHRLAQWLPQKGGSRVIVTTRQNNWDPALEVKSLLLGPLERQKSLALLRGYGGILAKDDRSPDLIAAELKDLPLALHMAGSLLGASLLRINRKSF